ncbi:unnamed protein product [Symbiodinium sp. CCMP2592]|nr:unnamed protein product [Symbiodinium sp. CCMP2592]
MSTGSGPVDNVDTLPYDYGDLAAVLPESPPRKAQAGSDACFLEPPSKEGLIEVPESPTGSTAPTVHFSPPPPALSTPSCLGMEDGIPFTQASPPSTNMPRLKRAHLLQIEDQKLPAASEAAMPPPSFTPQKPATRGMPPTPVKARPEPAELGDAAPEATVSQLSDKPASDMLTPELLRAQDMEHVTRAEQFDMKDAVSPTRRKPKAKAKAKQAATYKRPAAALNQKASEPKRKPGRPKKAPQIDNTSQHPEPKEIPTEQEGSDKEEKENQEPQPKEQQSKTKPNPKASPKGKAKAKSKAKAKAAAKATAEPQSKGKPSNKRKADEEASGKDDRVKKPRAPKGTQDTFAGRRVPKTDPSRVAFYAVKKAFEGIAGELPNPSTLQDRLLHTHK